VQAGFLPNGNATQAFNATANVPSAAQTIGFVSDAFHEGTQMPRFQRHNATSGSG